MQILGGDHGWLHAGKTQRQLDQSGQQSAALLLG
jgi:hypothetical protein